MSATIFFSVQCEGVQPRTVRRPPDPGICDRCGKTRGYRPADEPCCDWRGRYRGRHRKVVDR